MGKLSPITLGTMRFLDKGLSVQDTKALLDYACDQGITSLHVSPEYSSYDLIKSACQSSKHQLMVKLPAPHFDEERFDKQTLFERVDSFLKDFSAQSIDVAQWMWRMNPLDDDRRIERTRECLDAIKQAFDELKAAGKVKSFSCFPYSARYMRFIQESGLMCSQTNYLNFWEDDLYDGGIAAGAIALRPLGATRFRGSSRSLEDCLNYVLSHPNIESAVISMHTNAQIDEISQIASQVEKSEAVFNACREMMA
jgi:aryl-alcohol dehydrogenase-like predicted oxidoreductase